MNAAFVPRARALQLVLASLGLLALLASPLPAGAQDLDLEALVHSMTLDEKVGQLNQIPGGRSKNLNSRIDAGEHERIRRGAVGSYLHVAGAEFLGELQRVAVEESRLGIPLLFAMDVVHGYRTIFPVPLALASSFDPELVERTARAAAVEASASGLHWTFAPMVDIARDARWGRIVEGAGEDPYLGARMAAAQVRGFQGEDLSAADTVAATAKHFGAYGAAIGGRDYNSADLSQRTLEEMFLPPFFAAQQVGAASFMTAFNDVGGVPTTANGALLRDLLRDGWGYDGVVLSDWNAVAELIHHGVAGTRRDAAALALTAGVDMDMSSLAFSEQLAAAVRAQPDLEPLLDEAVLRVLRLKERLGLFDDPYRHHDPAREAAVILSPEHRALAREAARKSVVLLKNDNGLLPLDPNLQNLAVVGALADDGLSALGSWRAQGRAEDVVTLVDGLRAALPGKSIHYIPGADSRSSETGGIPAAVERVKSSDLTLLVVGEDYDWSGEARSRSDLRLPGAQLQLAQAVLATEKSVVVVLLNGRPMALPWLAEHAGTLVEAWLPGVEGGHGIADVLTGRAAPGGKLPASFPRATGQVPIYYNHLNTGRPAHPDPERDTARYMDLPITPLFPFGHGLSYADFAYSPLEVQVAEDGTITAAVTVTHAGGETGEHGAEEVVQLYARDPVARVARPVQELRGFHRIALEPGESQEVRFQLRPEQFAIYYDGQWVVEPGEILLSVGSSSADIRGRGSFVLETPNREMTSTGNIPPAALATISTATPVELPSNDPGNDGAPSTGFVQAYAPSFHRLVDADAEIEFLGSGYGWSEGPVWVREEGFLLFSDVPGNTMHRWRKGSEVEIFLQPSGTAGPQNAYMREPGINGMVPAGIPGKILAADHGGRAVVELDLGTRERRVLAGEYGGKLFNSPNDLVRRSDGVIFFTDPPYGLKDLNDSPYKEQPHNGVYRLDPDGTVTLLDDSLTFPNGIALSPDETTLYVANSDPAMPIWRAYELDPAGNVLSRWRFASAADLVSTGAHGLPDGMAVDTQGNLYATGPGGVLVFHPRGERLGLIATGSAIANCTFGEDGHTLFLTAHDRLARVRTRAMGLGFEGTAPKE